MPRRQAEGIWPPHFPGHQEIPEPIARILAISMQPNPSERYPSAFEMNSALAATSYGKKVKKASGSVPLPMVVVGVVAVAAIGLGFLAGTGKVTVPFVPNPNDQPIVLVLPTPTVELPTATAVPVVQLTTLSAHTVDTRRFPTNSVFFSALDANGALVQGLTLNNVKLTDNGADGKNLQMTLLRQTTDPVSVIFALDNSLLMKGKPMDDAKTAIHLFVDQMTPGDQMALMTFGGEGNYVVDYTVSKNQFLSAVDGVQATGKPDLFPAVMFAAQRTTFQPQGGYTALIVVSNSPLNSSKAVVQATTHAANLANLPIFYLGLDKSKYSADVVQQLASQTGGLAVVAEKPDAGGAWDAMRKIDAQLHDVYKLTYDSPTLDTKGAHSIELSVTANGATQTAKRSYEVLNK